MGQQNIFEHAIIGGLLTKLNQMCEKNLTLPIDNRTYLRFLSGIGFVDIAIGLANDSVPDIDDP